MASYREAGTIPGGVTSLLHPLPSVCWSFLFLIAASAIFAVSCWGCACCCGVVCAFIKVRWAASCMALLESVGSENGMVGGSDTFVESSNTDHRRLHVEL